VGAYGSVIYNSAARFLETRIASDSWRTSDAGVFVRVALIARLGTHVGLSADTHLRASFITQNRQLAPGGGVGLYVTW
jgi:hypothetical protein